MSRLKLCLDIYLTAYVLWMPIWLCAKVATEGNVSKVSMIVWLVIAATQYFVNPIFHSTLEWIGWKSKK